MRLLLLEDDSETAEAIEKGLSREGHEITRAADVAQALRWIEERAFDVAVLDLMVPGGTGYEVLSRLRRDQPGAQVLILTARGSVEERVEGLNHGADDYLVKPFSFAELAARVRACERRRQQPSARLQRGRLELDLIRHVAQVGGQRVDLTPTEFVLLTALVRAVGEPVGRRELLREVLDYDFDPGTNIIEVHVNRLRRKLEEAGLPEFVVTVRSRGYAVA